MKVKMWIELFCKVKLFSYNCIIDKIKNQLSFIFSGLNKVMRLSAQKTIRKNEVETVSGFSYGFGLLTHHNCKSSFTNLHYT